MMLSLRDIMFCVVGLISPLTGHATTFDEINSASKKELTKISTVTPSKMWQKHSGTFYPIQELNALFSDLFA
jgi:hypothetical protein